MTSPEWVFIAFALLSIAIVAVWLTPITIIDHATIAPWSSLFLGAIVVAAIIGVLTPLALIGLGLFCLCAYLGRLSQPHKAQRILFSILAAVLALALAMHRLPGFNNPVIISKLILSSGAPAFTQYANFDKGAAGLLLLAFMCRRTKSLAELGKLLKQTWPVAAITGIAVLGLGMLVGYVQPDFKIPQITPLFLVVNVLFAVIAEEVFFRGFLQDRLGVALAGFRYGKQIALLCSALLFGLVHVAGGPTFVLLATLSGLGYAYAYHVTQRIEAPIVVHFALNVVHFVGFTYPHLL